jgi:cell division protein FtsI (penicillin-binding protein 3)
MALGEKAMRRAPQDIDWTAAAGPPLWRLRLLSLALLASFLAIGWQLTSLGRGSAFASRIMVAENQLRHAVSRPDTVDRHGRMLASDIRVYWLFADPGQINGVDETVERLARVLSAEDMVGLRTKLGGQSRFEWIKRGLTPREAAAVHNLGLPGLHLIQEPQRVYPAGETAVHVLGHTNVDNQGLAGIEKYIDGTALAAAPDTADRASVQLSIDLRIQHALHEELTAAQKRYQATALGGIVLDVRSGEVVAMAGLPDYDPNRREESLKSGLHNRFYYDAYELGSVFKTFAVAMALDSGTARADDRIDVLTPLRMGRFTLYDRHAKSRYMTVEEVFTHSSNTGAARLALAAGAERQRAFFEKLGLMEPMQTELGATARPLFPEKWREVNTMTMAYGHGISVPPFAFAVATASLINGGHRLTPTFLPRKAGDTPGADEQVVSAETSAAMRRMFLANVENGTGTQAKVPGYRVGGKTGTAWKPAKGGYSQDVIASFVAAFPMDDPQYLVLIVIDEPKPEQPGKRNEAGHNAAPTAGAVIRRIAPMLGIAPARTFDESPQASY